MKNTIVILVAITLSLMSSHVMAQSNTALSNNFQLNVGLPFSPIDGLGEPGINGEFVFGKPLNEKWTVIGELNFTYFEILAANHESLLYSGLSGGMRYYWNQSTAKHPFFTDFSIGGGIGMEKDIEQGSTSNRIGLFINSGTYVSISNRLVLGLDFSVAPSNLFLAPKIGISF